MLYWPRKIRLSPQTGLLVEDLRAEWRELDRRILAFDDEFAAQARTDETARLLTSIPGIGPLNATALTAAVGNAQTFGRGRDLAAWLGLVPKQVTTGGKPKLLGISKRGNGYLRKMLIHGARAALPTLSKGKTPLGAWLRGLLARAHVNTVGSGARRQAGADRLGGDPAGREIQHEGCDSVVAQRMGQAR